MTEGEIGPVEVGTTVTITSKTVAGHSYRGQGGLDGAIYISRQCGGHLGDGVWSGLGGRSWGAVGT